MQHKKIIIFAVALIFLAGGTILTITLTKGENKANSEENYQTMIKEISPQDEPDDDPNGREKSSGFVEFSFEIKDSYANNKEIDAELQRLGKEYKENIEGCSEKYVAEQMKKLKDYEKRLYAKRTPQTNEEEKERLLGKYQEFLIGLADDYQWAKINKTDDKDLKYYQEQKELYEKAQKVDQKYKTGEYTLLQAYRELNKTIKETVDEEDIKNYNMDLDKIRDTAVAAQRDGGDSPNESQKYDMEMYQKSLEINDKLELNDISFYEAKHELDLMQIDLQDKNQNSIH